MAEDLELGLERPVEGERPGVVGPLVVGLAERQVAGAVDPGGAADVGPDVEVVAPGAQGRASSAARSGGQAGSSRQAPATSARSGAGRVAWRTNTVTGAPVSTPLRRPRSHRSHQRTSSGTRSMRGPGSEPSVAMWLQGPSSSRAGTRRRSSTRKVALR